MTDYLEGGRNGGEGQERRAQRAPDADVLSVNDGHLVIGKDYGAGGVASVAIYAPGVWLSAVVEDAQPT